MIIGIRVCHLKTVLFCVIPVWGYKYYNPPKRELFLTKTIPNKNIVFFRKKTTVILRKKFLIKPKIPHPRKRGLFASVFTLYLRGA
jgi:hypothetical protein